jgi:uncharacterized protein YcaQ
MKRFSVRKTMLAVAAAAIALPGCTNYVKLDDYNATISEIHATDQRMQSQIDALVDRAVRLYAPLPAASLPYVVNRLRYAVPQWRGELRSALQRARRRLSQTRVGADFWYWPADEGIASDGAADVVHLLAPFDPVVWDRWRFEQLWGWAYRFEAYTPVSKRKFGYYALPLLWRDRVIGWGNVSMKGGTLSAEFGYVASRRPRDRAFKRELEAEVERMRAFLAGQAR